MTKSKQQKYWFKERSHIWHPISWQGWLTLLLFIAIVIGNALVVAMNSYSSQLMWLYLNILATSVVAVIVIGYTKGPESK